MDTPGKVMLKVVSIVYIVFGCIFALLMLFALFLGSAMSALLGSWLGSLSAWVGGMLFLAFLIPAAVDLVVGILGVRYADNPEKSQFFIVTGIVLTVLTVLGLVFSFNVGGIVMFVMPVLFIVGGYMNRSAAVRR
jgi:hypothetical protein